jgi:hypothetical protein
MKTKIFIVLLVTGALWAVQPAHAHHAFAAQYDPTKPLTLNGIVTRMEWANPHGWIYMDTKEPGGKVKHWMIETAAPSQLSRHGLKKADFVDGMTAVVKGYQGKADPGLANGRTLVLKGGRSFYIGSVGGPNDGAEPQ